MPLLVLSVSSCCKNITTLQIPWGEEGTCTAIAQGEGERELCWEGEGVSCFPAGTCWIFERERGGGISVLGFFPTIKGRFLSRPLLYRIFLGLQRPKETLHCRDLPWASPYTLLLLGVLPLIILLGALKQLATITKLQKHYRVIL